MADSHDDIPPLEDMSEMIKQVNILRSVRSTSEPSKKDTERKGGQGKQEKQTQPKVSTPSPRQSDGKKSSPLSNNKPTESRSKTAKDPSRFAGMKKGFLFGESGAQKKIISSTKQNSSPPTDDLPFIKPKSIKEKELELPEVQRAMDASQVFAENREWVTGDLLTKITKSPKLAEKLTDPTFMSAVAEFQTNPTGAMVKYADNPEMQSFLKEFCGIMGEHFTNFAEEEEKSSKKPSPPGVVWSDPGGGADLRVRSSTDPHQMTAGDEERMQAILAMPEIRDILKDPKIQQLLETLKRKPDQAQSLLDKADAGLQRSIRKLVEVGLLQFQR